jgi:hypothetical protein
VKTDFRGGAGEISMGSHSSFAVMRLMVWRGGELRDTVEAKDNSRSEERKSSTSSRGCWWCMLAMFESTGGAERNWAEDED